MGENAADFLDGLYRDQTDARPEPDAAGRRLPPGWPDDVPEPPWWAELADTGIPIRAAWGEWCPGCGFGVSVEWQDGAGRWEWSCPSCGRRSDAPEAAPEPAADAPEPEAPEVVCRCGSRRFRDVPIHGGQSVRRDCAACGRFLGFPLWYGQSRIV